MNTETQSMRAPRPPEGYVVLIDHEGRMLNVSTAQLADVPEASLHALQGAAAWRWRKHESGLSNEPTTRFECRVDSVSEFIRDRTLAVVSVPNPVIEQAEGDSDRAGDLECAVGVEIVEALVDHHREATT